MKRKIALLLSLLSIVMMLGACAAQDPTTVDYNGVSYDELLENALYYGTEYAGATEADMKYVLAKLEGYSKEEQESDEFKLGYSLSTQWADALEECGAFVGVKEEAITVEKSGKTLTTDLRLEFEDRDVVFQVVYNYHNMKLTGVSVNPEYTFWEKMGKAGLNTVISMTIVFLVLIIISLIIYGFKFLPNLMGLFSKKEKIPQVTETKSDVVTQIEAREEQQLTDDTELVAVIAAAIAAYEGTSTDGFVVRSIRRR